MDANEIAERRAMLRLGILNGFVIGLAIAMGVWLPAIVALAGAPVILLQYAVIAIAALLVIAIGVLAGWITGALQHTGINLLVWLVAGALFTLIVAYWPHDFSTMVVWVLEPGLYGQPVFPPQNARVAGIILSGFFLHLALLVLGLLQQHRLQSLVGEWKQGERLTAYGWLRLLLPTVLVVGAALITGNIFGAGDTSRELRDLQAAIEVARTYDGDLFVRGLQDGINYAALRAVQDQLGPDYDLALVGSDPETSQTVVSARFQNGAWIKCRFINAQLSFCDDAAPPYTVGFAALITEQEPDCDDCLPQADESWTNWLTQRRQRVAAEPQITFERQRGAYVLMQAAAPDGSYALSCWFEGVDPVRLLRCQEEES